MGAFSTMDCESGVSPAELSEKFVRDALGCFEAYRLGESSTWLDLCEREVIRLATIERWKIFPASGHLHFTVIRVCDAAAGWSKPSTPFQRSTAAKVFDRVIDRMSRNITVRWARFQKQFDWHKGEIVG